MTERSILRAAVRIGALLFFFYTLVQTFYLFPQLSYSPGSAATGLFIMSVGMLILSFTIWQLPEILMPWRRSEDLSTPVDAVSGEIILQSGIVVIGLYHLGVGLSGVFEVGINHLLKEVSENRMGGPVPIQFFLNELASMAFGLVLTWKSRAIASRLVRSK